MKIRQLVLALVVLIGLTMGTVSIASAQETFENENAAEQGDNSEQAQPKSAAQGPKVSPPGQKRAQENWKKHVQDKLGKDFPGGKKDGGDDGDDGGDDGNGGIII